MGRYALASTYEGVPGLGTKTTFVLFHVLSIYTRAGLARYILQSTGAMYSSPYCKTTGSIPSGSGDL